MDLISGISMNIADRSFTSEKKYIDKPVEAML